MGGPSTGLSRDLGLGTRFVSVSGVPINAPSTHGDASPRDPGSRDTPGRPRPTDGHRSTATMGGQWTQRSSTGVVARGVTCMHDSRYSLAVQVNCDDLHSSHAYSLRPTVYDAASDYYYVVVASRVASSECIDDRRCNRHACLLARWSTVALHRAVTPTLLYAVDSSGVVRRRRKSCVVVRYECVSSVC